MIYITRHGESLDNRKYTIGGDSELSEHGHAYGESLARFFSDKKIIVWTSNKKRTKQTASHLNDHEISHFADLDELNAGICDGLTYDEIKQRHPDIFISRSKDKFNYRYPQGESYADVVKRLSKIIKNMKAVKTDLLIICHQAVARVLYADLCGVRSSETVNWDIPLHTLRCFNREGGSFSSIYLD